MFGGDVPREVPQLRSLFGDGGRRKARTGMDATGQSLRQMPQGRICQRQRRRHQFASRVSQNLVYPSRLLSLSNKPLERARVHMRVGRRLQ